MKKRNPLTRLMLLLAVLLTLGATQVQADILPAVSIGFDPVGLTLDQTARLNLVNKDVPNGIFVNWSFIDSYGQTLASAAVVLALGETTSVDFKRDGGPGDLNTPMRAEVRAEIDILAPGVSAKSLGRSLEIFNSITGETAVCLYGGR